MVVEACTIIMWYAARKDKGYIADDLTILKLTQMSIHQFSFTYLGPSHRGNSLNSEAQTSLPPRHLLWLVWGNTKAFPGQI